MQENSVKKCIKVEELPSKKNSPMSISNLPFLQEFKEKQKPKRNSRITSSKCLEILDNFDPWWYLVGIPWPNLLSNKLNLRNSTFRLRVELEIPNISNVNHLLTHKKAECSRKFLRERRRESRAERTKAFFRFANGVDCLFLSLWCLMNSSDVSITTVISCGVS